jgi:hypothetical protein
MSAVRELVHVVLDLRALEGETEGGERRDVIRTTSSDQWSAGLRIPGWAEREREAAVSWIPEGLRSGKRGLKTGDSNSGHEIEWVGE